MNVIQHVKVFEGELKNFALHGICHQCNCEVECHGYETKKLVDRDTTEGMSTRYVHCPECLNEYLWLK